MTGCQGGGLLDMNFSPGFTKSPVSAVSALHRSSIFLQMPFLVGSQVA
jgi:hypothetical protein